MTQNQIVISTFYKFIDLPNFKSIKEPLISFCIKHGLKGTILLAEEGINSTISGTRESINSLYKELEERYNIVLSNIKESFLDYYPFEKMKVRLKKEIVTMGVPKISGKNAGYYVTPEEWDDFISQPDVVLIDTRNKYEVSLGSFKGAINPLTNHFRDFPTWFDQHQEKFAGKKIAMCCTGGVRCEKSTAYVKSKGIENVYHLEGGILNYLEKKGNSDNNWYGECFVFDERIAVDKQLNQSMQVTCQTSKDPDGENYLRHTSKMSNL
jgi:UPF0176 protein